MEKNEAREYTRMLWGMLLAILLMFASASLGGGGRALPDAAFGLEDEEFVMPENPVLTVYVWEKDETETQTFVPLPYRTPVNCGPRLRWGEISLGWSGAAWQMTETDPGMQGLAITFSTAGNRIAVTWEHDGDDCRHAHGWLYSGSLDGKLVMARAVRSFDGSAEGHGDITVLWRGEGGLCYDTVTAEDEELTTKLHGWTTLADVLGREAERGDENITQDWMRLKLHVTVYDLLDNEIAQATLRVTMTSAWRGAGKRWNEVRSAAIAAEENGEDVDLKYLDYASVKPTWTVELVEYWQAEE